MPAVSVYTFERSRGCSRMEVLAEVLQLLGIAAFIAVSGKKKKK